MKPAWRRNAALGLIAFSVIGWIASAFWLARDEPPFILALSWGAILLTAVDIAATTDVRAEQDDSSKED